MWTQISAVTFIVDYALLFAWLIKYVFLHLFHDSYREICSVKQDDKYRDRLENYFRPLAISYLEICDEQHPKEFFGLRDFYRYVCAYYYNLHFIHLNVILCSLIKMLYWMVRNTNQPLTMTQLEHAIKRNFGGLDEVDAVGIFKKNIHISLHLCSLSKMLYWILRKTNHSLTMRQLKHAITRTFDGLDEVNTFKIKLHIPDSDIQDPKVIIIVWMTFCISIDEIVHNYCDCFTIVGYFSYVS